jgi:hypothetical protein
VYLPGLAILAKIPLILPCVDDLLQKIRGGWERGSQQTMNGHYSDNFTMYPNCTKILVSDDNNGYPNIKS